MWLSGPEALRLVRAASADVDIARARLEAAEQLRADLLLQLHGQELTADQLADAAGLSRSGFYREIRQADPGPVASRIPTPSELRRAVQAGKPAQRITPDRRVQVA